MRAKVIWIFVAIVGVWLAAAFIIPLFTHPSSEPLPDTLREELLHATNFEALALNHESVYFLKGNGVDVGTNQIMDYVVLGSVQITNVSVRLKLIEAVCDDIKFANHPPSACILAPRHGIRCINGTNLIVMAICYQCGDVALERNGAREYYYVKEGKLPKSRQIFEQIFHEAGVKEDEN